MPTQFNKRRHPLSDLRRTNNSGLKFAGKEMNGLVFLFFNYNETPLFFATVTQNLSLSNL